MVFGVSLPIIAAVAGLLVLSGAAYVFGASSVAGLLKVLGLGGVRLLRFSKLISWGVMSRFFMIWQGGWWVPVAAFFYLILPNLGVIDFSGALPFVTSTFIAFGNTFGSAYADLVAGLVSLPGLSGFEFVRVLVFDVFKNGADIYLWFGLNLWFARFIFQIYNPPLVFGYSLITFFVLSWSVSGVVPVLSDLAAVANIGDVLDPGRLNPFVDSVVNGSVNQTGNASVS